MLEEEEAMTKGGGDPKTGFSFGMGGGEPGGGSGPGLWEIAHRHL